MADPVTRERIEAFRRDVQALREKHDLDWHTGVGEVCYYSNLADSLGFWDQTHGTEISYKDESGQDVTYNEEYLKDERKH